MMCGMLALLLCGGCWVFAWKHLRRRIDERFDVLSEHLERHAAECPIRKEHLLASCLPADPERKGNGSFHRSFRASYPGFLPRCPSPMRAMRTRGMGAQRNSNTVSI
jgi:hypothetical protein